MPPGRPLHVAMALPWAPWTLAGGTERHVHELACALARRGVRVTVLVPGPVPPAPPGLPYASRVLATAERERLWRLRARLPAGKHWMLARIDHAFHRAAEREARALGADLLHRHFVYERRWRPALPLLVTLHTGSLPEDEPSAAPWARLEGWRRARAIRAALAAADGIVCVSEHVRASVLGRLRLQGRAGVQVIHNGCAPAAPGPSRKEARRALGLAEGERVVLFLGRLVKEKRVERLLPLLDEGCTLVLVGTGALEPRLRALASGRPALRVLGRVGEEAKAQWLRAADVLAVPSGPFEGNPLVMLEALRAGTPVFGATPLWLPPGLRPYGAFGEDVRLAVQAMAIDASAAPPLVPSWDEVAERTLAAYAELLAKR